MGSPVTSWDGVEAYFTFADNPTVMFAILILSVALTVLAIVKGGVHESEAYNKIKSDD
ncbi:MAG: hypothetical protein AAFO75_08990 [Pseudomonadota bacterium]